MTKKPDPSTIEIQHFYENCPRQDKQPMPHSLEYRADLTSTELVETWDCRNCSTKIIRRTSIETAMTDYKKEHKP